MIKNGSERLKLQPFCSDNLTCIEELDINPLVVINDPIMALTIAIIGSILLPISTNVASIIDAVIFECSNRWGKEKTLDTLSDLFYKVSLKKSRLATVNDEYFTISFLESLYDVARSHHDDMFHVLLAAAKDDVTFLLLANILTLPKLIQFSIRIEFEEPPDNGTMKEDLVLETIWSVVHSCVQSDSKRIALLAANNTLEVMCRIRPQFSILVDNYKSSAT